MANKTNLFYFVLQSAFMTDKLKDDLHHIRQMMEQSSRFISLSGLSGVVAGVIALIGAGLAYYIFSIHHVDYFGGNQMVYSQDVVEQLLVVAIIVLVAAIGFGILFTVNKSKRNGLKIWTSTTRHLITSLMVPLIAGGFFCLALLYNGYFEMIAPATLVFYGLALVNAAKYTYSDIEKLGYCEIVLGIVALFLTGYGLVFWALGFGVLHIFYGLLMYRKYK